MPKKPRGEKHPADVIADAGRVVRGATDEATSSMERQSPTMRMHMRRRTRRIG